MLLVTSALSLCAEVKTYKYSSGVQFDGSQDYRVKVDNITSPTYRTPSGDISTFEMKGKVNIVVDTEFDIDKVVIRPLSKKIDFVFDKRKIMFSIDKPQKLVVEVNGNARTPLFIFANKIEKNKPSKDDPNVVYFEAGKTYMLSKPLELKSNQTLYIEGGAIVFGGFKAVKAENVKVRGHGIISGQYFVSSIHEVKGGWSMKPLEFYRCKNVDVQDIIISESSHWSAPMFICEDVVYKNIKVVSDRGCDDGIDVASSKNVLIDNCFIRTKDDCIAIKSFKGNTEDVTIKRCILWNGYWGNAIEIGYESRGDEMKNLSFVNNTIIRCKNGSLGHKSVEGTLTIHNGDKAHVHNVLFKDIRIEDTNVNLFDMTITYSQWSHDKTRGKISNVRYENIYVTSEEPLKCKFLGYDENSDIKDITFKNVFINGKKVKSEEDLNLTKKFTSGIKFE